MIRTLFYSTWIGNAMKLTQTSKVSILFGHGNFESSELAHDDFLLRLLFCLLMKKTLKWGRMLVFPLSFIWILCMCVSIGVKEKFNLYITLTLRFATTVFNFAAYLMMNTFLFNQCMYESIKSIKIQIHVTYFNACAIQMVNSILKIHVCTKKHNIWNDGKQNLFFCRR